MVSRLLVLGFALLTSVVASGFQGQAYTENPLFRHGLLSLENKKFEMPDEVDVTEQEIQRFAIAVVDIAVLRNRISARMALGEENKEDLVIEWTHGLADILLEADMTVERYLTLDTVVAVAPLIRDDMMRHALINRADMMPLMQKVESLSDFQRLLEGQVDYPVDRELYQEASAKLKPAMSRASRQLDMGNAPGMLR